MRQSWDEYFLSIAELVATRSRDPDTQHGCLLADSTHQILSTGYNGPPPGCDDEQWDWSRPGKYAFSIHAEQNAVARAGRPLSGSTAYITGMSCQDCCRLLLAAGVRRIVHGDRQSACVSFDTVATTAWLCKKADVYLEAHHAVHK